MNNPQLADYFHRFDAALQQAERPRHFTYPFCYQAHPLCIAAAQQVDIQLNGSELWQQHRNSQNIGDPVGKMFGVLVVENQQGELGYLAAFSGKLANCNHHAGFVPPVYDLLDQENIFVEESLAINAINQQIEQLTQASEWREIQQKLQRLNVEAEQAVTELQHSMIATRKQRKTLRADLDKQNYSAQQKQQLLNQLAQQSITEKRVLTETKQQWAIKIEQAQHRVEAYQAQLASLKEQRKQRSHQLQHDLFSNYRFLNALGEEAVLIDLFKDTLSPIPPAGSGECAAPKLLQFAYQHQLKPIAMAEFWWGDSPRSAIRRHGKFYPSCNSKCLPILTHMLKGLDVETNPLLDNPATDKEIDIIYQDDAIVVINKPEEMLSVPGVNIDDSAFTRLQHYLGPREEGPFVLHRLDMSTSGLLVFALTKRANRNLQKQFINRLVEKRYVALVEGNIEQHSGDIFLPLAADPDDKPRQLVSEKHGKPAETYWEVVARQHSSEQNHCTKLYLYPKTGRTHQLRVHCSHPQGLNSPIVGDDLYGDRADRLHLHAQRLVFSHPYTRQIMSFEVDETF